MELKEKRRPPRIHRLKLQYLPLLKPKEHYWNGKNLEEGPHWLWKGAQRGWWELRKLLTESRCCYWNKLPLPVRRKEVRVVSAERKQQNGAGPLCLLYLAGIPLAPTTGKAFVWPEGVRPRQVPSGFGETETWQWHWKNDNGTTLG